MDLPSLDFLKQAAEREQLEHAKATQRQLHTQTVERLRIYLRKLQALKAETLAMYTALPAVEPFHASRAQWRVAEGSNQSSKTSAGAIEIARCVCNCDPYKKYPKTGKALAIGLDELHLADPMLTKLLRPGAFSLIRDEQTKQWRFLRHVPGDPTRLDPYDEAYREKWRDCPPILPKRLIRSIAWKDFKAGVAAKIEMHTGWTIEFRSSRSEPKQGDQNHFGWIDEIIQDEDHYTEIVRSFMRHNGVGIWTATPQDINEKLTELRQRADTDDSVLVVQLRIEDNFAISEAAKEEYFKNLSEEEREIRYYGISAAAQQRIYHYDPMGVHGCEPFEIPADWTRYCVVDPGVRYCGTLFAAVDPDEKHVWIYDGLVIRKSDANRWADEVLERQKGYRFEAIIIDQQAGKGTQMGRRPNVDTVAKQYWDALKSRNIVPRTLGPLNGFMEGTNNVRAREEALIGMMQLRRDGPYEGTPLLQVFRGQFPKLDKQIHGACYERKVPDKRVKPRQEDALVCLEYLAGFKPHYQEPEKIEIEDPFIKLVLRKQDQIRERNAQSGWRMS